MKKRELKNRLRRRTADKLYDFARSTGSVPAQLPGAKSTGSASESVRANGKKRANSKPVSA